MKIYKERVGKNRDMIKELQESIDDFQVERTEAKKRTLADLSDEEEKSEPEEKKKMTPEEFEELCKKPYTPGHRPLSWYQNKEKTRTYEELKCMQMRDPDHPIL